jgi:prepilin-type N-terminal cleavage/methylation domain-containing protein
MKLPSFNSSSRLAPGSKVLVSGFTLAEVLVAIGLGGIVLAAIAVTSLTFMKDFAGMVNYTDMDIKSRFALDNIARVVRGSTDVMSYRTNANPTKYLTLTNKTYGTTTTFTWDPDDKTLTAGPTGDESTLLTGCESFEFQFYQRTPGYNYTNIPATDASKIKLISMKWKCQRSILGLKLNSESVQEARIVIRN